MIDPATVIFAIESAVKLGRKVNEILIDATAERSLILPLGDFVGEPKDLNVAIAKTFFSMKRPDLIEEGGALFAFRDQDDKLAAAYRVMRGMEAVNAPTGVTPAAKADAQTKLCESLGKLDQFSEDFDSKDPVRRVFGTLVEIGVDYFNAHPEAIGGNSAARKVVKSFVGGLEGINFSEGSGQQVLGELLQAALHTVNDNIGLVNDDKRLQVLLGGITGAVLEDLEAATKSGNPLPRQRLFRRIASSIIRGGTGAFAQNSNLFMPGDGLAPKLVKDTLTQVFAGIKDKEDLFSSESLELVFKSALRATAENADMLGDKPVVAELIKRVIGVVGDKQWDKLFSAETGAAVLHEALEVARENMETLIDPENPQQQLLATALAAMAGSLSTKTVAGGGGLQKLLSWNQVTDLTRIVFSQVAQHPEQLIPNPAADPKLTVLAQVVGSVAKALGDKPTLVTNGAGFVELVRVALGVVVHNANALIDTSKADTSSNMLFKLLNQVVEGVTDAGPSSSSLVNRTVFLDLAQRVLTVASANLEPLLPKQSAQVQETVAIALQLASGALKNRINGDNFPPLVEQLLKSVLWDELHLAEPAAVELAATRILKAL